MKLPYASLLALLSLAPISLLAQRPSNTSICDYYTTTILGSHTIANEKLLVTLLVNTVVLGSYTTPNNSVSVHGFAAPGVYNSTKVALLGYFTPELLSTNDGGPVGVGKAFLDDGGAVPLQHNMSSNGNVTSVQYNLLNHIYQYFGTLLKCSLQGGADFPKYQGRTSMFEVHKFMDLSVYQMDFFIQQVSDSATALGFSPPDVLALYLLLQQFNTRCSAPFAVSGLPDTSATLNAVCLNEDCRLDGGSGADCALYPKSSKVLNSTEVALAGAGNGTKNATATTTGTPPAKTAASEGVMSRGIGELFWSVVVVGVAIAWLRL